MELDKIVMELKQEASELRQEVSELKQTLKQLQKGAPTSKGWMRMQEMRLLLGAKSKSGQVRPMSHAAFLNMVKNSDGAYEIKKVGKIIYVTKYPGMNAA